MFGISWCDLPAAYLLLLSPGQQVDNCWRLFQQTRCPSQTLGVPERQAYLQCCQTALPIPWQLAVRWPYALVCAFQDRIIKLPQIVAVAFSPNSTFLQTFQRPQKDAGNADKNLKVMALAYNCCKTGFIRHGTSSMHDPQKPCVYKYQRYISYSAAEYDALALWLFHSLKALYCSLHQSIACCAITHA